MENDLIKLLFAQEIDLEIDRLIKSKREYPRQTEMLKKEISDLKNAVDDIEARIVENKKNRLLIEEEIATEQDTLLKKDKRLLETKTNKEYNAVQHEIEQARERIDHLETEDLELMTELDTLDPRKGELREKYKATSSANNSSIKEIQSRFDSIESDIAKIKKKRERTLADVNERALSIYNRLRKGKTGRAIATVDKIKLSCNGCFKQLPPQKVLELRKTEKLIFCESCGRILMWDSRDEDK